MICERCGKDWNHHKQDQFGTFLCPKSDQSVEMVSFPIELKDKLFRLGISRRQSLSQIVVEITSAYFRGQNGYKDTE